MSLFQQAQVIYDAIKSDSSAMATVRTEYSALAIAIATDPDKSMALTSATVNGQTFGGTRTMTNNQRLLMLRDVVAMINQGAMASENGQAIFGN